MKWPPSGDYSERTERSVRDSDATVVFSVSAVQSRDSRETVAMARKHAKPVRHLSCYELFWRRNSGIIGIVPFLPDCRAAVAFCSLIAALLS